LCYQSFSYLYHWLDVTTGGVGWICLGLDTDVHRAVYLWLDVTTGGVGWICLGLDTDVHRAVYLWLDVTTGGVGWICLGLDTDVHRAVYLWLDVTTGGVGWICLGLDTDVRRAVSNRWVLSLVCWLPIECKKRTYWLISSLLINIQWAVFQLYSGREQVQYYITNKVTSCIQCSCSQSVVINLLNLIQPLLSV
jgi:hypothetical protein